jgi:oligoribonuclease NrnB/cAMP/cGMP phosphodiesterase (DHH superfamily)
MNTTIIYHANCPDGFGAAFAAWLVFGDSAQYHPARYDESPPNVRGKDVYILDFSYAPEVIAEMAEQASSLTLLDHHKTAKEKFLNFQCDCARVHFDLEQSGAMLAWRHFHPYKTPPKLIEHIQDRDLWRWSMENSAAYLAALDSLPREFEVWHTVMQFSDAEYEQFCARGRAMNEKFEAICISVAQRARPIRLRGYEGLVVNATPEVASRVGNLLVKRCGTFAVVWSVDDAGRVKVELRSVAPFEVHNIATHFGGGGHPQASGFSLSLHELPALLAGEL